jgi:DNA-binding MarR family transcriptional regulator
MPQTGQLAEQILALSKLSWIDVSAETADLAETEFLALDYLTEAHSAHVGEIQKYIGVLPSQMSRMLRRLESAGFTRSAINPEDRRKVDVAITESGRQVHAKYRRAKLAPIVRALERLSQAERAQFMALVQKMSAR